MELDSISYSDAGFVIDIPINDIVKYISWDSIDTIIYGPEIIYHDHSEFIIYLNSPPIITLKENPWWLNKYTFWMRNKNIKKNRIYDIGNKDFSTFIQNIKPYLNKVKDIDINKDRRKGTLIKKNEIRENNKTIIKEHWKPEQSMDFDWEMVYDRNNRTVSDIYYRDNGI